MKEPVEVTFKVNNGELDAQAKAAIRSFLGIGKAGREAGTHVSDLERRLRSAVKTVAGTAALQQFVKQIISVRGEMQNLGIALETMLGSKAKADAMMKDIVAFAMKTPFTLTEVADNAKQLMAMGIASEKVMATLKTLGDVAAGVNVPIARLAINYGQVSALGRLQQREIRDFAMAGVPVIEELAKMLNKTNGEINDMVEAGQIGFPLVEEAFRRMSGEGGKFNNLMEKMNTSLTGQISKLKDQIQLMFNEIGKSNEGAIYGAINMAAKLVENYEQIGKILVSLAATYGVYKAAVIAVTVTERALAVQRLAHIKGLTTMQLLTDILTKKTAVLNAVISSNKYVIVATAIAAIAAAVWAMSDSTDAAKKALEEYNAEREEAARAEEEHRAKIESLINTVNDEAAATYQRIMALEDLQKAYPGIFDKYDVESLKLADILSLKKQIAEIDGRNGLQKKKDAAAETVRELEEQRKLAGRRWNELEHPEDFLLIDAIRSPERVRKLEEKLRLAQADIHKQEVAMWQASLSPEERAGTLKSEIDLLERQNKILDDEINKKTELKKLNPFDFNLDTTTQKTLFDSNKQRLAALKAEYEKTIHSVAGTATEKNKAYWENAKAKAEAELAQLGTDKKGTDEFKRLKQHIADADAQLEAYNTDKAKSDKAAERTAENRLKAQASIDEREKAILLERQRNALDIEQEILDIQEDGASKSLQQNELNYRKKLQTIREQAAEMEREQIKAARDIYINGKGSDKGFDFKTFDKSLLPIGLRDMDIEAFIEKMNDAASKAFAAANKKTQDENKKQYSQLLIEYGNYEQKKKGITEKWETEIAKIPAELREGARRERDRELSETEADFIQKSKLWETFFDDIEKISLTEARRIGAELRNMILQIADPEVKKQLLDMLDEVGEKAEKNALPAERMFGSDTGGGIANFFMGSGNLESKISSFGTIFKGAQQASAGTAANAGKAAGAMGAAGSNAANTLMVIDTIIQNIHNTIKGINEVVQYFKNYEESVNGYVSQRTQSISESMEILSKFDEKAYSGWEKLKSGDVIGATTDNIIAWHSLFTSGKQLRAKWEKEIAEGVMNELLGEKEINRLYRERYEWAQKIGETTLDYLRRQGEELKRQRAGNEKDSDDLWAKLMSEGKYKTADYIRKDKTLGIDWLNKDEHIVEWASLAGKTWTEIELLASQGKLSEEGMKYYEALRAAKEEGEDLAARQEDWLEEMRETFAGSTYNSVVDSIVSAFKEGKRSAADFADTFNDLMTGALSSALRMMTDDKMRQWYENFAEMGEGGFTDEEIAAARESFMAAIEAIGENADVLQKIGEFSKTQQSAKKGEFETVSQDDFGLWLGQFAAIRIHVSNIYDLAASMVAGWDDIVAHFDDIEKNTRDTVIELREVNKKLKRMESNGVKAL
ncbi:MAG: tape measure protein [Tannerella sp.]|jgi:tape measure domain-containing protein|nr:tape measure protein [Tannerella sp.]